jgi:predicted regulator of Ras-like GTPase activity (Roadblock/LC7/MglB family)
MSLTDIINEAIDKISGALFAGVIGTDGLSVEMAFAGGGANLDLELAELELGTIASAASAASDRIGSGYVLDLTIETEDLIYLAGMVTPGYYAVLGVRPDASLGRARFAVRQMVGRIKEEL